MDNISEMHKQIAADQVNIYLSAAKKSAPYIGANGNWFVWSLENGTHIDTGIVAEGKTGIEAVVISDNKFDGVFVENTTINPTTDIVSAKDGRKCTPEYIPLSEELSRYIYVAVSKAPIDRVYVMFYDENKNILGQINILSSVGGATLTSRTLDSAAIKYFRLYTDMDYDGQIYISPIKPKSAELANYEYKEITEVEDIRTGHDGTQYSTAGESVRNQISKVIQNTDTLKEELLLNNNIFGTTQNVAFNADGTVKRVEHKDNAGNIVRTDAFTYADKTLTEVRTLSSGASRTFVFYYDSLKLEVK